MQPQSDGSVGESARLRSLWPIESVPLGDRTFEAIRAAIISGELAPSEPLKDRQLSEALGVSRTPVREALHRLEAAGLVETRGRAGWAVTAFTEQDVREIFQLRRLLEPVGLDLLERNQDESRIDEIASYFQSYQHPIESSRYPAYFRHDNEFHKLIVDCSGSGRIKSFYSVIESHINRGRFFLYGATAGRVEETLDEHLDIVHAVIERDFAQARQALLRHLQTGEQLMIKQLRLRDAGD